MIDPNHLPSLRLSAGYTVEDAAELCGVSLKTWRRYEEKPPAWALVMFRALMGDLGAISPAWNGWTLSRKLGKLYDDNNDEYKPSYLRSFWFRNQQASNYRGTIRELKQQVDRLTHEINKMKATPSEAANDYYFNQSARPPRTNSPESNSTVTTPFD